MIIMCDDDLRLLLIMLDYSLHSAVYVWRCLALLFGRKGVSPMLDVDSVLTAVPKCNETV